MTMGPADELRIPVRLDVSHISDDLAIVDREVQRLQTRMVSAFNRSSLVRRGRVDRAQSIEDVGAQRSAWTPELRQLDRALGARLQAIEREAQRGGLRPPPTPQQAARQAAQGRLSQEAQLRTLGVQAQTRPIEITARAKFFDDMRAGLMRGLPRATASAASAAGIPQAAGLARLVMGLVGEHPLVAGGVALGAGALAVNAQQAQFQRQQAALASALVGGPAYGSTRTLLGLGVMAAGQGVDTWPKEAQQIAMGLGSAGIGGRQLLKNLSNTLMVAKPNAIASEQITPLVAALGTAGGMKAGDINRTLQDTVNVAGDAGVSLQQLLQGMKTLSSGAVGAARDVLSLAAVQHIVGASSGIGAGALMQGVMGATGSQALQSAALLGMSPQAFMSAQGSKGGMAQIWDRIAGFARRLPGGAAGTMVTEQLLSQTGLLNMADLSATQQASLVQTLRQQGPRAAEGLAARYGAQTQTQAVSFQQSMKNAASAADNLTPAFERLMIGADVLYQHLINPAPPHLTSTQAAAAMARGTAYRPGGASYSPAALAGATGMGLLVSTGRPGEAKALAPGSVVAQAWAAARGDPVLASMMLAQMAHESRFQAGAIQQGVPESQRGYGIAQFTATLGTAGLRKYLGPGDWHQAALNQRTAIGGLAAYDRDLLAGAGGNVALAEARYNNPSAGANSTYAQQVYGATQGVEQQLQITVVVKDDRSKPTVTVDHHRVTKGHTQHGHTRPLPPRHGPLPR